MSVLFGFVGAVPFTPTHRVPARGTRAWDEPDASQAPATTLDANLPVQVVEQRADGWARVACANGWTAWVDGRLLVTGAAASPWNWNVVFERVSIGPASWIGATAAILGSFLPWLSSGTLTANAWDIGLLALLRGSGSNAGVKVGVVLLVVALVGLPRLTKKDLPAISVASFGGVATTLAMLVFLDNAHAEVGADVGIGLILTYAGGSAILADFFFAVRKAAA